MEDTKVRDTEAEMCTCKNYFEALQMLYIIGQAVIISAVIKEKLQPISMYGVTMSQYEV